MNFIFGRHGGCDPAVASAVIADYRDQGFILNIIAVDDFIKTLLSVIKEVDCEYFLKYILGAARDTKFKETTIKFIVETANRHFSFDQ